jgi:type VI secretion system protein ImpL
MMRRMIPWLGGGGTFLPFAAGAQASGGMLGLEGAGLRIVQAILIFAGLSVSLVVFWALYARMKRKQVAEGPPDEIDTLTAGAEKRLSTSSMSETYKLGKLPIALVLGPTGGCKTTVITRSGLEPELLAGEVYKGDVVVPTRDINVWFASDMIFLEAGGKVVTDEARWNRLVRRIRPGSFAAALGRGRQAPRLAIVCVSCEEFLKPGSSESVPALANSLRERLTTVSQEMGIRLPVYVLFTKTDRLPYFDDFVRNLTGYEAEEVWGATLDVESTTQDATIGERRAQHVSDLMSRIGQSLALRRLNVLPRETDEDVKTGAYEFPREFGKIHDLAGQFLLELTRPSQLSISPFLRGFYFTGVRAVVVTDPGAGGAAPASALLDQAGPGEPGATQVFTPQMLHAAAAASSSPASGGRKVPQWLFLKQVFKGILLQDQVAMGVTGGGSRVQLARRLALGLATAGLAALMAWIGIAYAWNDSWAQRGVRAMQATQGVMADPDGVAVLDDLNRLDTLREVTVAMGESARQGRRWIHLGLYRGHRVHERLREGYFGGPFRRALWEPARENLLDSLQVWDARADTMRDYTANYDALKAYLVMTAYPDSSSADFLAPLLMQYWTANHLPEPERDSLGTSQFRFYADELPYGNPYGLAADDALAGRTQDFLLDALRAEPFYRRLTADVSEALGSTEYRTDVAWSNHAVEGAYTAEGWTQMMDRLDRLGQVLGSEDWVLGRRVPEARIEALADEIGQRYAADYVDQWRTYLGEGEVAGFRGLGDAASKLQVLTGGQSPLLRLIALAADNAAVGVPAVDSAFQPVFAVTPVGSFERPSVPENQAYVQALGGVWQAMDEAAQAPDDQARNDALGGAGRAVRQAETAVLTIDRELVSSPLTEPARVSVLRLLGAPLRSASRLISVVPSADLNSGGASFCRSFSDLTSAYPFRASGDDADFETLSAMLQPGSGLLWSYLDSNWAGLLERRGSGYAARTGANPRPTSAFVGFFDQAAAISRSFYPGDGASARIDFSLRPQVSAPIERVDIDIDGNRQRFTATDRPNGVFAWEEERARGAGMTITYQDGSAETLAVPDGPWALFRLLALAQPWEDRGQDRYVIRWPIEGRQETLAAQLVLRTPARVLDARYLAGLQCVSQVAR